jgi:hypothetical protein
LKLKRINHPVKVRNGECNAIVSHLIIFENLVSKPPKKAYGPVSITSCGAFAPDSRLARLKAVLLVVVRAML